MLIKIITVGKKTPKHYQLLIDDYQKRISAYLKIEWEVLPPSSFNPSKARAVESSQIIQKLKPNDLVWLLDERGEQIDSIALTTKINTLKNQSLQRLVIIIGGAYGVSDELRVRANWQWSLSKMVFPHLMVRLILIEQLYRAQQIELGTGYHHA